MNNDIFQDILSTAEALYDAGETANGISLYDKALQTGPNDPAILNALAVSLAKRGHIDNAVALLQKAAAILPDNTTIARNLSLILPLVPGTLFGVANKAGLTFHEKIANRAKPQILHLLLTSRCNLNCMYCGISGQASDHALHRDMDEAVFDKILNILAPLKGSCICLSGGEITFMPDWMDKVRKIREHGFRVSLITNMAKMMSDEEIGMLASLESVAISTDTADAALAKRYRAKVRLEVLTFNLMRLRAYCAKHQLRQPGLSISCVMGTPTLKALPDLIAFAHACGVGSVSLTDVTESDRYPCEYTSIARFDRFSREETAAVLNEVMALGKRLNVTISIDALNGEILESGEHGMTRSCLDPWTMLLFKPNGDIHTCCIDYPPVGNMAEIDSIEDIMFGTDNMRCKHELLTGNLDPACQKCVRRKVTEPHAFQTECMQFLQITI